MLWTCLRTQAQLAVLPQLAEQGLAHVILAMQVFWAVYWCYSKPWCKHWSWQHSKTRWGGLALQIFPSYGFLLTADEDESWLNCLKVRTFAAPWLAKHWKNSDLPSSTQCLLLGLQRFTGFDYADILKKLMALRLSRWIRRPSMPSVNFTGPMVSMCNITHPPPWFMTGGRKLSRSTFFKAGWEWSASERVRARYGFACSSAM